MVDIFPISVVFKYGVEFGDGGWLGCGRGDGEREGLGMRFGCNVVFFWSFWVSLGLVEKIFWSNSTPNSG